MKSFHEWVAEPAPPRPTPPPPHFLVQPPLPSVAPSLHLPVNDHTHNPLHHPISPARASPLVHLTPQGLCLHRLQPIAAFPGMAVWPPPALSVDKLEDLMLLLWSLSLQSKPFPAGKLIITKHRAQAALHLAVCKWCGGWVCEWLEAQGGAWRLVRRHNCRGLLGRQARYV